MITIDPDDLPAVVGANCTTILLVFPAASVNLPNPNGIENPGPSFCELTAPRNTPTPVFWIVTFWLCVEPTATWPKFIASTDSVSVPDSAVACTSTDAEPLGDPVVTSMSPAKVPGEDGTKRT